MKSFDNTRIIYVSIKINAVILLTFVEKYCYLHAGMRDICQQ